MRRIHSWLVILSIGACAREHEQTPTTPDEMNACSEGWCTRASRALTVEEDRVIGDPRSRVVAYGGDGAIFSFSGERHEATDYSLPTDTTVTSFLLRAGDTPQAWASDDLGRTWWMQAGQWSLLGEPRESVQNIASFRADGTPIAVSTADNGAQRLLYWDPSRQQWLGDTELPAAGSRIDVLTSQGEIWAAALTPDRRQTWVVRFVGEEQTTYVLPYLGEHPRLTFDGARQLSLSAGLPAWQRFDGSTWHAEPSSHSSWDDPALVPCSMPELLTIGRFAFCTGGGQVYGGYHTDTLPTLLTRPRRMVHAESDFSTMPTAVWLGDRSTLAAGSLAGNLYRVAAQRNGFDRVNALGEVEEHYDTAPVLDLVDDGSSVLPGPYILTTDGLFWLGTQLRQVPLPAEFGAALGLGVHGTASYVVTETSVAYIPGQVPVLFRAEAGKRILSAHVASDGSVWAALTVDGDRCEIVHAEDGVTERIDSPCNNFAHLASAGEDVYLHTADASGNPVVRQVAPTAMNLPTPRATNADRRLVGAEARFAVTENWLWLYTEAESTKTLRPH